MAERLVKVTVGKEYFTTVYLKVDDNDPKLQKCFTKDSEHFFPHSLPPLTVEHAVENAEHEVEWTPDCTCSTWGAKFVPPEEVEELAEANTPVFNLKTGKWE